MSKEMYGTAFNLTRDEETQFAAGQILSRVLAKYGNVSSAIDVGCAVGTFLATLREMGATEVLGLDGDWVDTSQLVIDPSEFRVMDLRNPVPVGRRFDLAICLEVAEHLPADSAEKLVEFLCECSDTVLFSAAIPGQGGTGHLNEAWLSYWAELFYSWGYAPEDSIRPAIWNDTRIPFWYRQNCIVFKKGISNDPMLLPLDLVHPELYEGRTAPTGMLAAAKRLVKGFFQRGN